MQVIKHNHKISLERSTIGSAGFDVQAAVDKDLVIYPGQTVMIPLGFSMHINYPEFAGILLPRSGLGKKGIVLANTVGLIDSDYQGEVMAALKNTSNDEFVVTPLMRICQLIFVPVWIPHLEFVDGFAETTVRAGGGFGSTGLNGALA